MEVPRLLPHSLGVFPSSNQAEKANEHLRSNTINTWCKSPDKPIVRLGKSSYLQSIGLSIIGKTYREIGFYFVSKNYTATGA